MKKVLLIEDDEKIRRVLDLAFSEEGYEVVFAADGESGLEKAHSRKPDIILLDIMLPGMDGIQVCRLLKSQEQYKSIPILMLTALGDTDSTVKGLSAGADDYVSKPFNLMELLARVKSHLKMKELYDIVKTEEEEKSALLDVSKSLSLTTNPFETLQTIVAKIAQVIEVKRCSIIYVDLMGRKAFVMASHDSKELKYLEIDLNKYPEIQKVMQTGKAVVINDVFSDPILHSVKDVLSLIDIRSIVAFPILYKDALIGTLILRTSRREMPFSDREIRFCEVISHLAAAPLKNAYLFEILQSEKEREQHKREAAEESQKAARKYAQYLIDSSLDMIISTDKDRRIIGFNKAAQEIFGYSEEEVMGKNVTLLYADPSDGIKIGKILRKTRQFQGEIINRRKNGEIFPSYLSASVLRGPQYDFLGYMGISRDITELKKTEEELKKAKEKAEEATKLKDKFVSLVAHDLREPLGTMVSSLDLVRQQLEKSSDAKLLSVADIGVSSGKKMISLINDLLSLSRFKTGAIKPRLVFLDAYFQAMKVKANLGFFATQKRIELENMVPERTRIYADETLFGEVLHNLVTNAIKFSRPGDRVTISVPDGEHATIAVTDTGIGMDRRQLKKIFSYEEKTSTRGTMGESGTGFGLPLSRDLTEVQGGTLTAESSKKKGSVFYIRLRYLKPQVLVVDDDNVVRVSIRDYMKREDIEMVEAENGQEALNIVRVNPPNLILTNFMMPLVDGFELLQQIKSCPKTNSIPVILMTSDSNMETRERAFRLGAADFIVKPLMVEDFLPRVRKIIV